MANKTALYIMISVHELLSFTQSLCSYTCTWFLQTHIHFDQYTRGYSGTFITVVTCSKVWLQWNLYHLVTCSKVWLYYPGLFIFIYVGLNKVTLQGGGCHIITVTLE